MKATELLKRQELEIKGLNMDSEKEAKELKARLEAIEVETKKAQAKIEKKQEADRKRLAVKLVKELKKDLEILGYSNLLETKTVAGPVQVVKDMQVEERLLAKIKELETEALGQAKIKSIIERNLAEAKGQITEKNTEIEKLQKEVEDLKAEIEALKATPAPKTKKERVEEMFNSVDDSILDDVVLETVVPEVKTVELKKVEAFKTKRDDINMYESHEAWVLASNGCQEVTVIPKNIREYSEELYNRNKQAVDVIHADFRHKKLSVSPITIRNEYQYFVRVNAAESVDVFSPDDKYAGYVAIDKEYYLFSFVPSEHSNPVVTSLGLHLAGLSFNECKTNNASIDGRVQSAVRRMFDAYLKEATKIKNKKEEEVKANTEAFTKNANAAADKRNSRAARIEAAKNSGKILNATQNKNNGGDNKGKEETPAPKANNQASSTSGYLDSMF